MATNNLIKGIDISIIQSSIPWQAVADSGIAFCICRCGVGNSSIDTNYKKNIAGAKEVGIKPAAYHFIYPLPPAAGQPMRDPILQARFHFNAAGGELALIDCEWPAATDFVKWGCSPAQIRSWMTTYFTEYERLDGRKPCLYTYPYWAQAVQLDASFAQYPLWIASYQATPATVAPWGKDGWTLWQNSGGTQHLPNGVAVDTDFARDLSLWDTAAAPVSPAISSITTQPQTPSPVAPAAPPAPPAAPPSPDHVNVAPDPIIAPQPEPLILPPGANPPSPRGWQVVENVVSEIITDVENNPNILTTIWSVVSKVVKVLLSIK